MSIIIQFRNTKIVIDVTTTVMLTFLSMTVLSVPVMIPMV